MPWPYRIAEGPRAARQHLDAWLPPGARLLERHSLDVRADPGAALDALRDVPLRDLPVVGVLLALRGIAPGAGVTIEEYFSTAPFLVLEDQPGRELVFGVVGPFWQFGRGRMPPRIPRTPAEFRDALAAGRMAAIANLRADPAPGGARLSTETWVSAPGRLQAGAFTAYWLAIGPFSAWIRRLLLRGARERLERGRAGRAA